MLKSLEHFDNITLATDIICGFPTETKEQFQDSISLMEKLKLDVINISKFNARPGTEAYKMEQVKGEDIKNRSRLLTSVFDWIGYGINKKWLNWEGSVLVDDIGKEGTVMARNFAYKPIAIMGKFKLGDKVKVKITDVTKHYLIGEKV